MSHHGEIAAAADDLLKEVEYVCCVRIGNVTVRPVTFQKFRISNRNDLRCGQAHARLLDPILMVPRCLQPGSARMASM